MSAAAMLGIGCAHAPLSLNPPEEWSRMREDIFARVPNFRPPPELDADPGDVGRIDLTYA